VAVPALVLFLVIALVVTLTRNWNAWEAGRIEQVTDDAFVRGDVTPLSTKVAGIVRDVNVSDFQQVLKGDLLVALEHDDYSAQMAQAVAVVEAAKAAIENNRRQRELQDARIERALAGVDEANAQIAAAQSGEEAVRADVVRTQKERKRQEALLLTSSSTPQKVEQVVADQQRFAAQLSARELAVIEILFALVLIVALALAGSACLIGYAVLLWLERPRPSHAKPRMSWKERSIEP
jgi:membrane fusion protein (multidrug efflux system)